MGESKFQEGELPWLIDIVAQFSCVRTDVLEQFARSGERLFLQCTR